MIFIFFDLPSLRPHIWILPFPSENFGRHGKKVLQETADPTLDAAPLTKQVTAAATFTRGEGVGRGPPPQLKAPAMTESASRCQG